MATDDADVSIFGTGSSGYFGFSTLVADLDDEGQGDIISAAPYVGRTSTGVAYVFFSSGF
jgi:hypothetical protein